MKQQSGESLRACCFEKMRWVCHSKLTLWIYLSTYNVKRYSVPGRFSGHFCEHHARRSTEKGTRCSQRHRRNTRVRLTRPMTLCKIQNFRALWRIFINDTLRKWFLSRLSWYVERPSKNNLHDKYPECKYSDLDFTKNGDGRLRI